MRTSRSLASVASIVTVLVLLVVGIVVWAPGVARGNPSTTTLYLPLVSNCPSAPTLSQPANGTTLTPPTLTPLFTWTAPGIGGQTIFYVDVTTDPTFQSYNFFFVDSTVANPCAGQLRYPGNLNAPGQQSVTYYWRVSLDTDGACGLCSAVNSFTVPTVSSNSLLPAPTITEPANNATVSPNITFSWQAVLNASDYLVTWEPTPDPSVPANPNAPCSRSDYSFQYTTATQLPLASPLTPGTAYDVCVAARNAAGTSDPQAFAHFTTSGVAPSSVQSERPVPGVAHGGHSASRR